MCGRPAVHPGAFGAGADTSLRRLRIPTARRPRPRAGSPSDDSARLHLYPNDYAKIPRYDRFSFSIFHITFVICHCRTAGRTAMTNDKRNMEYGKRLKPDVVHLDLAVERRVVHPEQFRGATLMAACDFERAADQLDFEARDLVVERDAAGDVEQGRRFRHVRRVP